MSFVRLTFLERRNFCGNRTLGDEWKRSWEILSFFNYFRHSSTSTPTHPRACAIPRGLTCSDIVGQSTRKLSLILATLVLLQIEKEGDT